MAHDFPPPGHNHDPAAHLRSHLETGDEGAELQALAAEFIQSFRTASDKAAFLALAGIPRELPGKGGAPSLKLVDVKLSTEWQVGTASPAFGSRQLSYLPFPGEMISERTNMGLVYVSLDERREVDLRDLLARR